MALTATTLSAPCGMSDLTLFVTSSAGFAAGQPVKIDNEYMICTNVPAAGGSIQVRSRGNEGTIALPHDVLANVETSAFITDFPGVPLASATLIPPHVPVLLTVGQNATITLPNQDTTYIINKATPIALTLPTPDKAHDGMRLTFTSQTAQAHVVTATGLYADGVTGGPHGTATFGAFKGAGFIVLCDQGLYNLLGNTGVTFT